ncbi:MAG: ATP-binding protein [Candidatus Micrarchaeia archaeon]
MKEDEIAEILLDWNFWEKEQPAGIPRPLYQDTIKNFLKTNQIIVIIGVRRSGKSTIMMQTAKTLIDSGTDPHDILLVNFEDYRFYEFSLKLLQQIYDFYLEKIAKGKDRYIFLDEVHNIKGWERFVRTLVDKKEAKIIVSGSSSKLMGRELATLLTGRHINLLVFPLTFKEFLLFKNLKLDKETERISRRREIKKLLAEFLGYGSFPEVVLADKKVRYKMLVDYIESIINKDIVTRYRIKETQKLRALVKFYMTNIASPVSFNKIKNWLSLPLRTVERFSYYLEEAYLVYFLRRFSFKVKKQEKSARKIYVIDQGLSNAYGLKFSANVGRVMENVVLLELLKNGAQVYYWKSQTGKEVDFVIEENLKAKQLIQICYDVSDYNVKIREASALIKASEELKCRNLVVITWDYESEEKIQGVKIKFVPLWKWLLDVKSD